MSVRIGISGGHSRSHIVAIENNEVIGTAVGNGFNDHVNFDHPELNPSLSSSVDRLLSNLIQSINENNRGYSEFSRINDFCDQVESVFLAMPGVSNAFDHARISASISKFGFKRVEIVDDTWAALVAGVQGFRGLSVMAGT